MELLVGAGGLEPQGLTVAVKYAVSWKKQDLDTAKLAKLRSEEKLV